MSGALTYGAPERITEVKAAGDAWEVSGYASVFNTTDHGNDVVVPGAFTKSLGASPDAYKRVRFLFSHDPAQVLGAPLSLEEDTHGLRGRWRISKTRLGEEVHTLLMDGALDSFSIGYIPRDFERDDKTGIRRLKQLDLLECSLVALPMQSQATVTSVKEGFPPAADYTTLSLEQLLEVYDTHRSGALGQAKAIAERRLAEGRKLSDQALATLEHLRTLCEEDATELLRLATTTPRPEDSAPVETAGLVESHLRRARLRELGRIYGVTTP